MSKKWLSGLLAAVVLAANATIIQADDHGVMPVETDSYGTVSMFTDGRLNAFDLSAPVAIYYQYDTVSNTDGTSIDVLKGIELLAIDPVTNNGQLALAASLSALADLTSGKVTNLSANGYSLHYASGWFWVTAPADAEGKVYRFAWENLTIPVG